MSGSNAEGGWTRREFIKSATLASALPWTSALGSPARGGPSCWETPTARFFSSLNVEQRSAICFAADHPLRTRVSENWKIVEPRIVELHPEQRSLVRVIFRGTCGDNDLSRFLRVMSDDYGGFENYHVALFGEPTSDGPFEFVLTGRHLTIRADGKKHEGASFAGPIFHGHSSRSAENVWNDQAEVANRVFLALSPHQRSRASAEYVTRSTGAAPGMVVDELDDHQVGLVGELVEAAFRPFRLGETAVSRFERADIKALRLSSFDDQTREVGRRAVWKLEGPGLAWSFHGLPHVHSWLSVGGPNGVYA